MSTNAALRTLFKGGGILFVGLFVELAISFVAKLVIARVLGPVNYGAVSLGITTATIVSTVVLLGLNTGIGRYLPTFSDDARRRGVLVSAFQVGVPLSLLASLLIVVFAPTIARVVFTDPATAPVLRIFALAIPLAAVMKLAVGSVQGLKLSLPKVYIQNISLPTLRFVGILAVLSIGFGATGVAWAYVFSYLGAATLGVYFLYTRTTLFDRTSRYEPMHSDLLLFSAPLVVSTVMTFVFADMDTFMLGYFSSTGDVGVYNTIYPIALLLTTMLSSFGFIFMPVIAELYADGDTESMRTLYQVVTKWIFTVTVPLFVVVALFPEQSIRVTFGEQYVSGALALSVLSVAFFSHAIAGPNSDALTSLGRTRLIMYDNTLVAAVNFVLNVLLIPRYGVLGAAVATAVAYVLLNALYSYQLYRETGIQPFTESLLRLAGSALVLSLIGYVLVTDQLGGDVVATGAVSLAVAGGYLLAVLRFGVGPEELVLLDSVESRFGLDLGRLRAFVTRFSR
ncbi:flippase [Haladaptatus sp. GCM10025707]|uniref:flippase n=1 Tax=unclassified Haladaptatus TaxID=2622732 RepID=UPI0023E880C1|nr:flippase [Haladaptatus sp. QDMS2]